jgi:hypothetical protein
MTLETPIAGQALRKTIESILADLKPEATYFGCRTQENGSGPEVPMGKD